ncbi:hypothetical protein EVAR_96257_1 [Eumeta japonica]|uniref:Uncharacterized protein n=1 Tax=Eumeta variegata TaxID=151549 RepID=A0A4C1WJU0_EUMVA|nr:hypothetical protein EVAR_96257_1 [Eumeta japonica]
MRSPEFHPVSPFSQGRTDFAFNSATVGINVQPDDVELVNRCRIQVLHALEPELARPLPSPLCPEGAASRESARSGERQFSKLGMLSMRRCTVERQVFFSRQAYLPPVPKRTMRT